LNKRQEQAIQAERDAARIRMAEIECELRRRSIYGRFVLLLYRLASDMDELLAESKNVLYAIKTNAPAHLGEYYRGQFGVRLVTLNAQYKKLQAYAKQPETADAKDECRAMSTAVRALWVRIQPQLEAVFGPAMQIEAARVQGVSDDPADDAKRIDMTRLPDKDVLAKLPEQAELLREVVGTSAYATAGANDKERTLWTDKSLPKLGGANPPPTQFIRRPRFSPRISPHKPSVTASFL